MRATVGRSGQLKGKSRPLQVRALLEESSRALGLELIAGKSGLSRRVLTSIVQRPGPRINNRLQPRGVLLLDSPVLAHLAVLPAVRRRRLLESWIGLPVAAVVISSREAAPRELYSIARRRRVAVFATGLKASVASKRIGRMLEERLAEREVIHGVLMEVHGLGILIVGESGVGKSESAIELIERGHRLIADDVVELEKSAQGLVGRSPKIVRHYMELRGLGVINVKDLFGANAIQLSMPLQLVVRLERWDKATEVERLGLEVHTYTILGVDLPLVTMPVGPGRNLAMLIEVAARNHLMSVSGRNPARLLARSVSTAARRRSKGGR